MMHKTALFSFIYDISLRFWNIKSSLFVILLLLASSFELSGFAIERTGRSFNLIQTHIDSVSEKGQHLHFFDEKDAVLRFREIQLNEKVKTRDVIREGDELKLNLFDDASFIADVIGVESNINATVTLRATIQENEGFVTVVTTGKRSLGSIFIPEKNRFYQIISEEDTYRHYLIEMDARDRDILESSPPLIPETTNNDLEEQERIRNELKGKELGPDDTANIDVMVVYTPNAEDWAQSYGGGIDNVIAMAMANAQLVLDNSETLIDINLVHADLVNYTESGSSSTDLRRITAKPGSNPWGNEDNEGNTIAGHLNEVHAWRYQSGADLTALFSRVDDTGGIAWLLTDKNGIPNSAFSITRVQQAAQSYTHIHEMGHNMGLHHHKAQNFQPGPTNWSNWQENVWSAGWRWKGTDDNYYCSVMTYASGSYYADGIDHTSVPYFSNPEVTYNGASAGDAQDGDNARTLKEIKHKIAAYRTAPTMIALTGEVDSITYNSAVSGGYIVDSDSYKVNERGLLWGTSMHNNIFDHHGMTEDGAGDGVFTGKLEDLEPGTTYYVRAYATTENQQTFYGVERIFETEPAFRPTVSSGEVTNVIHNRAVMTGNVTDDGTGPVSSCGIIWGKSNYPSLENGQYDGITYEAPGIGEFASEISGLELGTTYYVRAYAENTIGVDYGVQTSFTTMDARVYPNPAIDRLYVDFDNQSTEQVVVELINMQGQVVREAYLGGDSQGGPPIAFETTGLRTGIYLLHIDSDQDFPVWHVMVGTRAE